MLLKELRVEQTSNDHYTFIVMGQCKYRSEKKQVQFSVNVLHVHSMDLLSQYESSEDNETCSGEDSPGTERVFKEINLIQYT